MNRIDRMPLAQAIQPGVASRELVDSLAEVRSPDAAERLFEVILAATALLILSPLFFVIGMAVKAYDGGPMLYRATRVGKDGRLFKLYKFRTMLVNADAAGPGITASGDSRITPIGQKLRDTKLDELPQLFNVLVGDMSFVGPRPEDPRYVALYTPQQRRVLGVRPGITGAASLAYRHEEQMLSGTDTEATYCSEVMPRKLEMDLEYLTRRTMWSDLDILVHTALTIPK